MGRKRIASFCQQRYIGKLIRIVRINLHPGLHAYQHTPGFYFQDASDDIMPQGSRHPVLMPVNIHFHPIVTVQATLGTNPNVFPTVLRYGTDTCIRQSLIGRKRNWRLCFHCDNTHSPK